MNFMGEIPNSRRLSEHDQAEVADFLRRVKEARIREEDRHEAVEQYRELIVWWRQLFDIGADWEVCQDLDVASRLMADAPVAFLALSEAMQDWGEGDMARLTRQLLYEIGDLREKLKAAQPPQGD